eukprot:8690710-Pyramimonas_sp.AAC.1
MAYWYDSGSSRRNSQVDSWRWNPENNVLACFRVFKRCLPTRQFPASSNEAVPRVEINRCMGPTKRDLGGR